ncbi:MAG TPA: GNAT family N-acetyltransferase [Verrucomicrobiae bacterium]|nr:GNAT family N-acetyltransferase [Verrucomicrobiae bacterium]
MIASIRESKRGDREKLLAMYAEFQPKGECQGLPPSTEDKTMEWLRRVEDIGSAQFVIEVGRTLVGHAMLCPGPREKEAELAVFLLQDFRELGLGKALTLGALHHGCKELALDRVWVSIQGSNPRGLRLFEGIGFQPVKEWDPFTWELEMERPSHCVHCKLEGCFLFGAGLPRTMEVPRCKRLTV